MILGRRENMKKQMLNFNSELVIMGIEQFIKKYFEETKTKKLIIGLSGGIDSSTTLKLAVDAVGPDNVLALVMPHYGITEKADIEDAYMVADKFGVECITIELADVCGLIKQKLVPYVDVGTKPYGNIIARTRMITLYAFSNSMNGIVLGTSDKSEKLIGYFTKWGDAAADIFPIVDLYKTQVRIIAKELGVPDKIIAKPSSPGLWRGHKAEEEIGMSYDRIDSILYALVELNILPDDLKKIGGVLPSEVDRIIELMQMSMHKRTSSYPEVQKLIKKTS